MAPRPLSPSSGLSEPGGVAPHPSGGLLRVPLLPYVLSCPLAPHPSLPDSGAEKVGLGASLERSRQTFSDLGAKGPGGHLQVPASPPHSLPYPKTSGCLLGGGGNREEETPGCFCLLSLKTSPWGQMIWPLPDSPEPY